MGWPRNLVLVRHAESIGNVYGEDARAQLEEPTHQYDLTPLGVRQAEITGEWLKREFPKGFDTYYVSYYKRSRRTMEIMFPQAKLYEDPRLAEAQRGIFHTMTKAEVQERFPEELERLKREGLYHYRPFGGENWPDVELRIHSFLGTLNRDCEGLDVVMVVHGHWLILLNRLLRHFTIEEAVQQYQRKVSANASVTIYRGIKKNGQDRLEIATCNHVPWKGLI